MRSIFLDTQAMSSIRFLPKKRLLIHNNPAWLLATTLGPKFRDGAERACQLSGCEGPNLLDILAAACA
jgi:hypothetical protein